VKTPASAPYLLPPETAVVAQPWTTDNGDPLGDRIDHWDPFTQLDIFRAVEVDIDAVRAACLLGTDSALALTATWVSTKTRLGDHGPVIELGSNSGLVRAVLSLTVPGPVSGGRLDLRTRLILRHPGNEPSPISPQRPGAVLWDDETRTALEGGAARFPITAADFRETQRYPDAAAWVLDWDTDDLEVPVMGGMRLLINSSHTTLLETLRSGSSDPRAAAVRSFVMFDVARSLVRGALENEVFLEDPESFTDGSVGRMLADLLTTCWPGVPVTSLHARLRDDSTRLDAELQAHFGVLMP
jgi:hypothetical protein